MTVGGEVKYRCGKFIVIHRVSVLSTIGIFLRKRVLRKYSFCKR